MNMHNYETADGGPAFTPLLSERVDLLFSTMHSQSSVERTAQDVADKATAIAGSTVSAELITGLRSGAISESTPEALAAIAEAFTAPSTYLTERDGSSYTVQLQLLTSMRNAAASSIFLRGNAAGDEAPVAHEILGVVSRLCEAVPVERHPTQAQD